MSKIHYNTRFTQMQDDSNLKMTHQIKHVCQGKMYISKSKTTPKTKMSAERQYVVLTSYA